MESLAQFDGEKFRAQPSPCVYSKNIEGARAFLQRLPMPDVGERYVFPAVHCLAMQEAGVYCLVQPVDPLAGQG